MVILIFKVKKRETKKPSREHNFKHVYQKLWYLDVLMGEISLVTDGRTDGSGHVSYLKRNSAAILFCKPNLYVNLYIYIIYI